MRKGFEMDTMIHSVRSMRVLLIEDDEDDYVFIRDSLLNITNNIYTLTWAATFEEGMQKLENNDHDVCLLDYRLGAHDGLEILREAGRKGWPVPVILLTGQGEYDVDVRAMKAGASDYLVKEEINPGLLERSIRYAVEKARAWNALQRSYEQMERRVEQRTSELVEANRALKLRSEQIKMFAYMVSHDLKSPVVAIHGLVRRLLERSAEQLDEKGRLYCRRIMTAAEQITELADSVNLYIKARELSLRREEIHLQEVFRALEKELHILLKQRDTRLVVCDENPRMFLDRILIMRALRNLVENALKHGGPGLQTIRLEYRNEESSHVLSISDDGRGIEEGESEGLFSHFSRAEASSSVDGMGLGLAIVKEVAERHGGESWIEPVRGKGLKVCLSVSKGVEPATPAETRQTPLESLHSMQQADG